MYFFQKNSEGQQVFDLVCKHLDIIETDYFGLTFRDKTQKKVCSPLTFLLYQ